MRTFHYKAKAKSGKTVSGSLQVDSLPNALRALSQKGYFPLEIREERGGGSEQALSLLRGKIALKDLALFTRQLADLVEASLPLPRVLEIVRDRTVHPRLKKIVEELGRHVREGKPLSESLKDFQAVFPPLYIGMVCAGERGGDLAETFLLLADYFEQQEEFRARVRAALAYPLLVALVGAGTVTFLAAVVVPKLSAMFSDMGQLLPLPTRAMVRMCAYSVRYGWLGLLGVVIAAAGLSGPRREALERMALHLPLLGSFWRRVAVAHFAKTLGALLSSGVPVVEALRITSGVMGNIVLRAQTLEAAACVRRGSSLAEALKACPDFPPLLSQMVAIGEEGNTVERALDRVAAIYERESERAMKTVLSLVEPALILLVGGAVGVIVITMLLPIFQISAFVR